MRGKNVVCDRLLLAACLLASAQGCMADGAMSAGYDDEEYLDEETYFDDADASIAEPDEEKAVAPDVATEELVRRVAAMSDKTLVVFDFDDTLMDHVDGQKSRWASYAKSAVTHLKQQGIAISVASRNKNSNGSLNRALKELDSQVFSDAFFRSPAFQDDTGLDKSDDIRQIMAHFGIKQDGQVVFFDDNAGNIERVDAATNVISIMVNSNGIDREEFRDGMDKRLGSGGGGGGGGGSGGGGSCSGKCSSACPCTEGQGDCDSNADCAAGLICPPDRDGAEQCMKAPGGGGGGSCAGKCSSACPCSEGQGDCDSSADCASGLVCPPDGPGSEVCMKSSDGGGGGGGGTTGTGNLRVLVGGRWVSVGCGGGSPKADGSSDKWTIVDRKLRNQAGVYLHCGEGWPDGKQCECNSGGGEAYHAVGRADFNVADSARKNGNMLTEALAAKGTMYIFPNNAHEFCLAPGSNNVIYNKDGGDDGSHHESTHKGKCNEWCFGSGCP